MKSNNRRYYLHSKIKKKGYRYSSILKTVYIPYDLENIDNNVLELQKKFNYSIQTEIPN